MEYLSTNYTSAYLYKDRNSLLCFHQLMLRTFNRTTKINMLLWNGGKISVGCTRIELRNWFSSFKWCERTRSRIYLLRFIDSPYIKAKLDPWNISSLRILKRVVQWHLTKIKHCFRRGNTENLKPGKNISQYNDTCKYIWINRIKTCK